MTPPAAAKSVSVAEAVRSILRHPLQTLIYRWNWKSALFSAALRAPIFFSANMRAGFREAMGAAVAESIFRAASAGVFAACTQALRNAEPAWGAALILMVVIPFCGHVMEFLIHWARGTQNLSGSIIASVVFTIISTLFNWYAMRNGALVVGDGGRTLASDMARMPRLILGFITFPFRAAWRALSVQS